MYNVSSGFQTAIKQTNRTVSAKVVIGANTYTDDNIVSLELNDTSNPDTDFEIGTVASATINLTLMNVTEAFETATYQPSIGILVNGAVEWVPLGTFYADKVTKNKGVVELTLYDGMIKLEQAYFSNLTYPATITDVMNEICTDTGVTFSGALPAYTLATKPEGYKYREVVGIIAQLCGGFAKFDRSGNLAIKYYTASTETITTDNYVQDGYQPTKDVPYRVDQIVIDVTSKAVDSSGSEEDTTTSITKGTVTAGGSSLEFANNFATDAIATDIYNRLNGFSFQPATIKAQGNPATEVGDIITFTDDKGNSYQFPVMKIDLTYSGGLLYTLEAVGESENKNQFDSSGSMSSTVNRVVYDLALINTALINKATIDDLNATNAKIDNLTVSTAMIDDLAVTTAKIANAAIGTAQIANLAVTAAQIANATITSAQIAQATITGANIANATIGSANIENAAITTALIGDAQITTAKIANAAITSAQIGDAQITTAKIATGAITTALLGTAVVDTGNIKDLAVTDAKINSLTANKLTAGTIDTGQVDLQGANGHLRITGNRVQVFDSQATPVERVSMGDVNGDGSVYGFLMRGADGTTVLMDINGVKTAGITDGAITNPKIGSGAVQNTNIAAATITGDKLVADTITAREIASATITANEIAAGTITAASGVIANAAITTAMIADLSVTGAKIADATITNAKITGTLNANQIVVGAGTNFNANYDPSTKSKTFTSQPVPPYYVGDIWKNGSTTYICQTTRTSGSYTSTDWVLTGDVTANNTASDTAKVNGTASSTVINNITTAQNTANSKAKTYTSTPTVPYNVGDIWKNGQATYICTVAKTSTGTYSASDWTLSGDVTSLNTAADTAKVNGTAAATVVSNASAGATAKGYFNSDGTLNTTKLAGTLTDAQIASASKWNGQGTYIDSTGIYTGNLVATQIVSGTISVDRIAAASITSDKLSVTDLSAISANLGSVNAGTITGVDFEQSGTDSNSNPYSLSIKGSNIELDTIYRKMYFDLGILTYQSLEINTYGSQLSESGLQVAMGGPGAIGASFGIVTHDGSTSDYGILSDDGRIFLQSSQYGIVLDSPTTFNNTISLPPITGNPAIIGTNSNGGVYLDSYLNVVGKSNYGTWGVFREDANNNKSWSLLVHLTNDSNPDMVETKNNVLDGYTNGPIMKIGKSNNPFYLDGRGCISNANRDYGALGQYWDGVGVQSRSNRGANGTNPVFVAISNDGVELFKVNNNGDGSFVSGCSAVSFNSTSDERLKDNITKISNALEKLKQINGVHYQWNEKFLKHHPDLKDKNQVGVIAQHVEKVLPEAINEININQKNNGRSEHYKAVDYTKLVPLLIESIKEMAAEIEGLKKGLR